MSLDVSKNSNCYVCGADNPLGLQVPFSPDGTQGSQGRYTARAEHAGWNGILHGGVTFALMDEAFGYSLYFQDLHAVTARAETRFHKPISVGTKLIVKAWVVKQRRRLFDLHSEIRVDGPESTLLAEADATMFLLDKAEVTEVTDACSVSA
ncbi:MAG: thioesterase [Acidobacteria bacterium]|nr:MAG: thioesterase [Acidobacteriota bacterium]